MIHLTRLSNLALVFAPLLLLTALPVSAQESRLVGRVPESVRGQIDALLDSATALGIPTEPLVDRALEGASKGAGADLIVRAVLRLTGELVAARDALGLESTEPEIKAGASALRAGARPEDLAVLRDLRTDLSLTIPAAVLADLVAFGVPADTATAAVIALAEAAEDAEYIAFRRNVERDISIGVSPTTAIGVRLDTFMDASAPNSRLRSLDVQNESGIQSGVRRRPRKP